MIVVATWWRATPVPHDFRQMCTSVAHIREDCRVKAVYPDSGSGDGKAHPEAVPGLHPNTNDADDAASLTLEVDGETFTLRSSQYAGTDYTWLSGPNLGYGFGAGTTLELPLDEHRENIRDFLAMVDPHTGYIEGD